MRVLQVINGWAMGGIAQATLDLVKTTPSVEHFAAGYCWLSTSTRKEFEEAGCESIVFNDNTYRDFGEILDKYKIDIVQKQTGGGDNPEWIKVTKDRGLKFIEHFHCPRTSGVPKEMVDYSVAASNYVASKNTDREVEVLPFPCTLPVAKPKLYPGNRKMVFGRLARYEVDKLPEVICQVAQILHEYKDHIQFLIMGYPFNEQVYKKIQDMAIPDYLIVEGLQEDKAAALQRLDVCINPTWEAGFEMVMTEAMSQGMPVITWKNSAGPETCGSAGIVTEVGVFALAQAVYHLFNGAGEYNKFADQAIRQVKEKNDPIKYGQRFESIYKLLCPE